MAERGTRADQLALLHPTDAELAIWFKVSTKTIERRKKDPEFSEILERGRTKGKLTIRRAQMKMAETNPTMAIWLGKVILNQTEINPFDPASPVLVVCMPRVSISIQTGESVTASRDLEGSVEPSHQSLIKGSGGQ